MQAGEVEDVGEDHLKARGPVATLESKAVGATVERAVRIGAASAREDAGLQIEARPIGLREHVFLSAGGTHCGRDHVLDSLLEPQLAVGEWDVALIEQVRAAAGQDEVLRERAAAPHLPIPDWQSLRALAPACSAR